MAPRVADVRPSLEERRGYRYVQDMFARHRARGAPRAAAPQPGSGGAEVPKPA